VTRRAPGSGPHSGTRRWPGPENAISAERRPDPVQRRIADLTPGFQSVTAARTAAKGCRACHLYKHATQTVFGEGPARARIMMVGEQPGDAEDLAGRPFVGPAGQLLDRALAEAGIDRTIVYVTNAVKHFKFEPRGKRRIHKKPGSAEIGACRPWLETEIALVKPRILVCLGATAAQALLGRAVKVTAQRGTFVPSPLAPRVTLTVHPSSILRAPDEGSRRADMKLFVRDLKRIAAELEEEE